MHQIIVNLLNNLRNKLIIKRWIVSIIDNRVKHKRKT